MIDHDEVAAGFQRAKETGVHHFAVDGQVSDVVVLRIQRDEVERRRRGDWIVERALDHHEIRCGWSAMRFVSAAPGLGVCAYTVPLGRRQAPGAATCIRRRQIHRSRSCRAGRP